MTTPNQTSNPSENQTTKHASPQSSKNGSSSTLSKTLIDLEKKFWRSLVDQDVDAALEMISEPSLMVGTHGAMKFDHAGYRKMAEQGPSVLTAFELSDVDVEFPNDTLAILTYHVKQHMSPREKGSDKAQAKTQEMNDTSTWIQKDNKWLCVMHTETPAAAKQTNH